MSDLFTLEGYENSLLGKFKKPKKLKKITKAIPKPVKKFAKFAAPVAFGLPPTPVLKKIAKVTPKPIKKLGKKALPYAASALALSVGMPIPPSVAAKGIKKAAGLVKTNPDVQEAIAQAAIEKAGITPGTTPTQEQATTYIEEQEKLENQAISKTTENIVKDEYVEPAKEIEKQVEAEAAQPETAEPAEALEGYDNLLFGYELGALKKLKKKAKKAVKKTNKVAKATKKAAGPILKQYGPTALTALSTAVGLPIPPQAFKAAINMASGLVKKSGVKNQLTNLALEKIGVSPGTIETINDLTTEQKVVFNSTRKNLENQAISKTTEKIIATGAEKKKWNDEQIKAFNESQSRGDDVLVSFQKAESAGDMYYKKGLLQGNYADDLKILATKIFSQSPYPEVNLVSYKYVQNIVEAYVYSCLKLSQSLNRSMFYDGTTEAERQKFFGNLYVRIAYLYFKGLTTEADAKTKGYDYTVRDQVWVVISLIRDYAEKDSTKTFMKFWKPYDYKSEIPDSPVTSKFSIDPKIAIIGGGIALAAAVLLKKRR